MHVGFTQLLLLLLGRHAGAKNTRHDSASQAAIASIASPAAASIGVA